MDAIESLDNSRRLLRALTAHIFSAFVEENGQQFSEEVLKKTGDQISEFFDTVAQGYGYEDGEGVKDLVLVGIAIVALEKLIAAPHVVSTLTMYLNNQTIMDAMAAIGIKPPTPSAN